MPAQSSWGAHMTSSATLALSDPFGVRDHQPPRAGAAEVIRPTEEEGTGNILL